MTPGRQSIASSACSAMRSPNSCAKREQPRPAVKCRTLAIPFVQAITTSLTVAGWQESDAGLPPWDAATKVVMPEFDGRIIGPVAGFRQQGENGETDSETESYTVGHAERIRACVNL